MSGANSQTNPDAIQEDGLAARTADGAADTNGTMMATKTPEETEAANQAADVDSGLLGS